MERLPSRLTVISVFVSLAILLFAVHHSDFCNPTRCETMNDCKGSPASSFMSASAPFEGGQSFADLEATPLARNMTLPYSARERGIARLGAMERFQRFLYKVIVERKPITAAVVGGSVTGLLAGQRGDQGELFNQELQICARQCDVKNGWLVTPLTWLTDKFPPKTLHPRALFNSSGRNDEPSPFQLINLGMGGRGPDVYFTCLGKTLLDEIPEDLDLLVVEYALNYPILDGDQKGMVESILQSVWKRIPDVAVLFVNFHYWCQPTLSSLAACRNTSDGPMLSSPRTWSNMRGTYSDYQEDCMKVLADFYDLPLISVRDALYPLVASQTPGYGLHDILKDNDGGWHPNVTHADALYSDLIIHFLHSTVTSFPQRARHASPMAPIQPPPPADFSSTLKKLHREHIQTCYYFDGLELPGRSKSPIILASQGFKFQPDEDASAPEIKRGYISRTPGDFVELKVETDPPAGWQSLSNVSTIIRMWHLKSYERMGMASYACSRGCKCKDGIINATYTKPESVPQIQDVAAIFSETNDCHIRLETAPGSAGGTKFKLLSIEVIFIKEDHRR